MCVCVCVFYLDSCDCLVHVDTQEAALKRSQRAERFGLSKEEGEGESDGEGVERREARAKRFGTKLVAYKGEPIKLVDKYVINQFNVIML